MKQNKLTAGANVIWESSRMILSQHRAVSLLQDKNAKRQVIPELTEEEKEEIFGRLKAAKANTLKVTITVFGELETYKFIGIVTGLDPRQQLIKIEVGRNWHLIEFRDVIGVEMDG